jgi:hypothetical protein
MALSCAGAQQPPGRTHADSRISARASRAGEIIVVRKTNKRFISSTANLMGNKRIPGEGMQMAQL